MPERKQVKCCLLDFLSAEKEILFIDTSLLVVYYFNGELLVHFFSFSSSQIVHTFVPNLKTAEELTGFVSTIFLYSAHFICAQYSWFCVCSENPPSCWKLSWSLSLQKLVPFVQKSETTPLFQTEFKGGKTISWLVF